MLREMRAEMDEAAGKLQFERAAALRDQIRAIEKLSDRGERSDQWQPETEIGYIDPVKGTLALQKALGMDRAAQLAVAAATDATRNRARRRRTDLVRRVVLDVGECDLAADFLHRAIGHVLHGLVALAGLVGSVFVWRWRTRVNDQTGAPHHRVLGSLGTLAVVLAIGYIALAEPFRFTSLPYLRLNLA